MMCRSEESEFQLKGCLRISPENYAVRCDHGVITFSSCSTNLFPLPGCAPGDHSKMEKIVDEQGHNAGYATFVETMAKQAEDLKRLKIFLGHEARMEKPNAFAMPVVVCHADEGDGPATF